MPMSAAFRNFAARRQQQRHDRLETEESDDGENENSTLSDPESLEQVENSTETGPAPSAVVASDDEGEEDMDEVPLAQEEGENEEPSEAEQRRARRTVTLVELEEERELARRRTSACVLLAVFVLFRLWIEAIAEANFGLLLLCMVFTSWTARYIRYNREREEELDRRIAAYWNAEGTDAETAEMPRSDLQMLSFQAQLALAIMESQRQLMQGGFGHPDGENQADAGVSDDAREQWTRFKYMGGPAPARSGRRGSYGSLGQEDVEKGGEEEEPTCSICLGEYEDGDNLVKLPCGHVYHEECVGSWTSNHVRCPLCNFDLESVSSATPSPSQAEESMA